MAQGRQEYHKLNGFNVIGNGNQSGLLCLNEGNDMVQTIFDDTRLKQHNDALVHPPWPLQLSVSYLLLV